MPGNVFDAESQRRIGIVLMVSAALLTGLGAALWFLQPGPFAASPLVGGGLFLMGIVDGALGIRMFNRA